MGMVAFCLILGVTAYVGYETGSFINAVQAWLGSSLIMLSLLWRK